jgi:SAM-dependent methyltransferase
MYGVVKNWYHRVVPLKIRHGLWQISPKPVLKLRRDLIGVLRKSAKYDEIYDLDYYKRVVDPATKISAVPMAASIINHFRPKTVVDVGCGTGLLLAELTGRGASGQGLEYSEAACNICKARGLNVRRYDIEKGPPAGLRADVVISMEVAEHLAESFADRFVDLLCATSDAVVLTAAKPGPVQGVDHVNEQPEEYWIAKFESRGRVFERELSGQWRSEWKEAGVAWCFYSTLMIFSQPRKGGGT